MASSSMPAAAAGPPTDTVAMDALDDTGKRVVQDRNLSRPSFAIISVKAVSCQLVSNECGLLGSQC